MLLPLSPASETPSTAKNQLPFAANPLTLLSFPSSLDISLSFVPQTCSYFFLFCFLTVFLQPSAPFLMSAFYSSAPREVAELRAQIFSFPISPAAFLMLPLRPTVIILPRLPPNPHPSGRRLSQAPLGAGEEQLVEELCFSPLSSPGKALPLCWLLPFCRGSAPSPPASSWCFPARRDGARTFSS